MIDIKIDINEEASMTLSIVFFVFGLMLASLVIFSGWRDYKAAKKEEASLKKENPAA